MINFNCFGERAHTRKGKMTQSSGVGLFLADSSSRTRESVDCLINFIVLAKEHTQEKAMHV